MNNNEEQVNNYLKIFYDEEFNKEKNLYTKVNEHLKRLEKTGDFFKIKHIKKLYEYHNILYNLKKKYLLKIHLKMVLNII